MKKLIAAIMAMVLLTGCASTSQNEPSESTVVSQTPEAATDQAESTAAASSGSETVSFGSYRNRKIQWYVLDQEDGKALLLSVQALDSRPFSEEAATWDRSSIRAWLNGGFYQEAFSDSEKQNIIVRKLTSGDDLNYGTKTGQDTEDRVFLLSASEAKKYLSKGQTTTSPTDYASSQGAYTNDKGDCAWWLRSPGINDDGPAYYSSQGDIGTRAHQSSENIIGIRPAMWVNADALQ